MHKLSGSRLKRYSLVEETIESTEPTKETMNEKLKRPEYLLGSTYKIKPTDGSSSALYITINDIVLNEGTEFEEIRPFEIFINSKNVEHVQWVAALTRVMSAIFRKGGDVSFLCEELEEVFDPRGGYFVGSKMVDSLVAHIGHVLKQHMKYDRVSRVVPENTKPAEESNFPKNATLCKVCRYKAVIVLDNCPTCLNCGDGKCG